MANFHLSRQLSCRDKCKIATWSDDYLLSKSNLQFYEVGLWASKFFVWWVPGHIVCLGLIRVSANERRCYICIVCLEWSRPHISFWTKWPPIWQTTFSNAFLSMKTFVFRFKFHWSFFLEVQLTIGQHWCWWLALVVDFVTVINLDQ